MPELFNNVDNSLAGTARSGTVNLRSTLFAAICDQSLNRNYAGVFRRLGWTMSVIAYLDPASGSLIAATVAGGLAGVGVAAKSMWRNNRFRKSVPDGTPEGDELNTADEDEPTASEVEYASPDDH